MKYFRNMTFNGSLRDFLNIHDMKIVKNSGLSVFAILKSFFLNFMWSYFDSTVKC